MASPRTASSCAWWTAPCRGTRGEVIGHLRLLAQYIFGPALSDRSRDDFEKRLRVPPVVLGLPRIRVPGYGRYSYDVAARSHRTDPPSQAGIRTVPTRRRISAARWPTRPIRRPTRPMGSRTAFRSSSRLSLAQASRTSSTSRADPRLSWLRAPPPQSVLLHGRPLPPVCGGCVSSCMTACVTPPSPRKRTGRGLSPWTLPPAWIRDISSTVQSSHTFLFSSVGTHVYHFD